MNDLNIDGFIGYLEDIQPLSKEMTDYLRASVSLHYLPRHHVLIAARDVPNHIWFITSGSARVFYWDDKSVQEQLVWLYSERQLIIPFEGLYLRRLAETTVVLNESAAVVSLSFIHIKYMAQLFPEYHALSNRILENLIVSLSRHLHCLQHSDTRQRYDYLLETRPGLLNSHSLRDVASFLGMSLSALRHLRYRS